MVTLVIENGSIVENANSYQTVSQVRAFSLNRGISLPVNDDEVSAMLIRGWDYINGLETTLKGRRVDLFQSSAYPRNNLEIYGDKFPNNKIPSLVLDIQAFLVMAIADGFDIQPNVNLSRIKKKTKVGPLETEYANPKDVGGFMPVITAVQSALEPLLDSASGFTLSAKRV